MILLFVTIDGKITENINNFVGSMHLSEAYKTRVVDPAGLPKELPKNVGQIYLVACDPILGEKEERLDPDTYEGVPVVKLSFKKDGTTKGIKRVD